MFFYGLGIFFIAAILLIVAFVKVKKRPRLAAARASTNRRPAGRSPLARTPGGRQGGAVTRPLPPTLTFLGAARTVTGSKFLVESGEHRVLVDCGLYQGPKRLRERNWLRLPLDPSTFDAVVLTHAHIDHCGYVPRLVQDGFSGPVYATSGTRALAGIVLPDSGHLHEGEARFANRRGYSKHDPALPLYTEDQARASLEQFVDLPWGRETEVAPGVAVTPRWAGHILGAASLSMRLGDRRVAFSGDLGPHDHPILPPPDPIGEADLVLVESTYGDESRPESDAPTASPSRRPGGGPLVSWSSAFAVGRTESCSAPEPTAGRVPALPLRGQPDGQLPRRLHRGRRRTLERHPPELWGQPRSATQLRQARTRGVAGPRRAQVRSSSSRPRAWPPWRILTTWPPASAT